MMCDVINNNHNNNNHHNHHNQKYMYKILRECIDNDIELLEKYTKQKKKYRYETPVTLFRKRKRITIVDATFNFTENLLPDPEQDAFATQLTAHTIPYHHTCAADMEVTSLI